MCEDRIKAGTQGCSVGHGQSRSSGWSSPTTRRTRLPKASLPTLLSSLIFVRVTVQFESFRKLKHTTCRRWRFVQRFRNILYVLASVACAQHQTGWIFGTSGFTQTCWRHTTFMLSLRTCHVFLITGHVEEMNGACYPCPCIFMHWLLAVNSISIYGPFNILYIE